MDYLDEFLAPTYINDSIDYINSSINATNRQKVNDELREPHYWAIILGFIPLATIFGNVLVVISVIIEKNLRTITNYFVVSLAIADLTVASAVMPFAVYYEVLQAWNLSQVICDAWVAADVMASTASILNLVAIAIDRFIAVTRPIKYSQSKNSKRISLMIALVWATSALIAFPIIIGFNNVPHKERNLNECTFNNPIFLILSSIFSFYIPAIAMFFLYYKIFSIINSRAKKQSSNSVKYTPNKDKKQSSKTSDNSDVKQQEITTVLIKNPTKKSRQSLATSTSSQNKEKKVTKTLAIVIGCFLTFWFPFFVNNLVTGFCMKFELSCNQNLQSKLATIFTWLGYMNSCLNPIIYTTFNIEFRKAFVKILRAPFNCFTRK